MQKTTIIHKYAVAPLLAIAAMHAAVWLGSKNLADFSRAFDVTLGLDALIPLRPEWVVIYVVTFLFWMMGLLFAARQDEELCFRFASGVIIAEIICCVIFIAFPSCITRPELAVSDFFTGVLSLVYFFDTPTNCFPSMHCLFAYLVFRQSLSSPGVRVAGDSMEPRFHDGQTVWVSQQHSLMTGEIGIFLYDGCAYLKQLVAGDGYLALHSLNPAYPDIRISPALPLRVLGKVLAA